MAPSGPSIRERINALEKRVAEQEAEAQSHNQKLRTWRESRLPVPPPRTITTLPDLPSRARTFATLQSTGCSEGCSAQYKQPGSATHSLHGPQKQVDLCSRQEPPMVRLCLDVSNDTDVKQGELSKSHQITDTERQLRQAAVLVNVNDADCGSTRKLEADYPAVSGRAPSFKITTPAKHASEFYLEQSKQPVLQAKLIAGETPSLAQADTLSIVVVAKDVENNQDHTQPDSNESQIDPSPRPPSTTAVERGKACQTAAEVEQANQGAQESVISVLSELVGGNDTSILSCAPAVTPAATTLPIRSVSEALHPVTFWRADSTGQRVQADESWIRKPSMVRKRDSDVSFASRSSGPSANLSFSLEKSTPRDLTTQVPCSDDHYAARRDDDVPECPASPSASVDPNTKSTSNEVSLVPATARDDSQRPAVSPVQIKGQFKTPTPSFDPVPVAASIIEARSSIAKVTIARKSCSETNTETLPSDTSKEPASKFIANASAAASAPTHEGGASTQTKEAFPDSKEQARTERRASTSSDQTTIVRSPSTVLRTEVSSEDLQQQWSLASSRASSVPGSVPEFEISVQPRGESCARTDRPVVLPDGVSVSTGVSNNAGEIPEVIHDTTAATCSASDASGLKASEASMSQKEQSSQKAHATSRSDTNDTCREPQPISSPNVENVNKDHAPPDDQGICETELDKCYELTRRAIIDYSAVLRQYNEELLEVLTQTKALLASPSLVPKDARASKPPNEICLATDRHVAFLDALIKIVEAYARDGWHTDLAKELPLLSEAAEKGQQARVELFNIPLPVRKPEPLNVKLSPPAPSCPHTRGEEYHRRTSSPYRPARPLIEELRALKRTERSLILKKCDVFALVAEGREVCESSFDGADEDIFEHWRCD